MEDGSKEDQGAQAGMKIDLTEAELDIIVVVLASMAYNTDVDKAKRAECEKLALHISEQRHKRPTRRK